MSDEISNVQRLARRRFLRFLAASPIFVLAEYASIGTLFAQESSPRDLLYAVDELEHLGPIIVSPSQALDVFDFVPVARKKLPPAHFGHVAGGVDDDGTMRINRAGFDKFALRPRHLVDVHQIDMSISLFGTHWTSPIFLSPIGGLGICDPDGEVAVAKAARAKDHMQILSTAATKSVQDVAAARGGPIWFQLYPKSDWDLTAALVRRAEATGCPVLVLTVDSAGGSNRETEKRFARLDTRQCSTCHGGPGNYAIVPGNYEGLDLFKMTIATPASLEWDVVKRLKDLTKMKLVIKGILTAEDTHLALANGVDGIIVSNHGGRHPPTGRSTIETLPEVVEASKGNAPVLIDSGFRRGTDIYKALALGATAVGIGRAYAFALAAFGQPGVEAALAILRHELHIAMAQNGTPSIDRIKRTSIVKV
jgi:isopentenyl diphosphate isomerase/L-lactate dehydrogenase-like FMN-dependent dehydrogenase